MRLLGKTRSEKRIGVLSIDKTRFHVIALAIASLINMNCLADESGTSLRPLIISTWEFGKPANEAALARIEAGGSTLDAVEAGIRQAEGAGLPSVGLTGRPNAAGYVQLDACIMHGPGQKAGSVAGIEGIAHPISVARLVMERTPHVMLVGEGARLFALQHGCESVPIDDHARQASDWWKERPKTPNRATNSKANHDTITLLVLGADGTISGGCSTSGLANKYPGRVGDSPICGSGLYVDNEVGAAGATGVGENVMRYCASFLIVEMMRQGMDPQAACEAVIRRIASTDPKGYDLQIHFIALDKRGRFGAAATGDFPHAVTYPGYSEVCKVAAIQR
jgi:isoaspartyl peptidase/L-asparaginase-like protein (Ntn-hydrolase superfamily)